jgi:hypothetical protein
MKAIAGGGSGRELNSAIAQSRIDRAKVFFDMKDGVPMRDRVGMEFDTNAEAIKPCKEIAQDFRDNSLRDDQDLEILVVNDGGREIHREFGHRVPE